jgi:hypothetical protein
VKKSIVLFVALGLAAVAFSASAEQLLFTKGMSKSGSSVAIDYVSDGRSAGLQIEVAVPGKAQVDLSDFAKALPKGFTFEHNLVNGTLVILVVNDLNQPFPEGLVSLGTIKSLGGSGEFVLSKLESVGPTGEILSVETVQ